MLNSMLCIFSDKCLGPKIIARITFTKKFWEVRREIPKDKIDQNQMSVFYCLGTLSYLNRSFGNEARILLENPFSVSDEQENELPSTEESQTQRFDIFYLFSIHIFHENAADTDPDWISTCRRVFAEPLGPGPGVGNTLLEDDLHSGKELLAAGNDLSGRKQESVEAGVSELGGVGVPGPEASTVPVVTGAGSGVWKGKWWKGC